MRRRRHRLFAFAVVLLLAVAAVLLLAFDDDDGGGFADEASATCEAFEARVQEEFALSFPEGTPSSEAEADYLGRAFADTIDELVVELRALEGPAAATAAIDALAARVEEIRADPQRFVDARANPFAEGVAPRFDDLGAPACGSEFLGGQE